jgi:hypothetical protein
MAALNGPFVTSGNDLKYYPDTPFQILYGNPAPQTNTFHVRTGTMIYMPINSVDDSLPILTAPPLDKFPTNNKEAVFYWSDKSQFGLSETVTVDGNTTVIPTDYVVGPVESQPLFDRGGSHIITVGVFLTPFNKGRHTVSFTVKAVGDIIVTYTGGPQEYTFTYTVEVD